MEANFIKQKDTKYIFLHYEVLLHSLLNLIPIFEHVPSEQNLPSLDCMRLDGYSLVIFIRLNMTRLVVGYSL